MNKIKQIWHLLLNKKDAIDFNFTHKREDKLLTEDEEAIVYGFIKSPDWIIIQKLIDNEIKNLYIAGMSVPSTMDEYLGFRYMIGEHKRFKTTIRQIAKRVEVRKKKRIRKK